MSLNSFYLTQRAFQVKFTKEKLKIKKKGVTNDVRLLMGNWRHVSGMSREV